MYFSIFELDGLLTEYNSCRGYTDDSVRNAFEDRVGLWGVVCLDWGFVGVLSGCDVYYALEDEEGMVKLFGGMCGWVRPQNLLNAAYRLNTIITND